MNAARRFSQKQLRRAKEQMKVVSFKARGKRGRWFWALPQQRTTTMANLFEKLNEKRPRLSEGLNEAQPQQIPPSAQKLLDWFTNYWGKPIICARDIYRHGPNFIRENPKSAIAIAEILVAQGELIPIETHRRDRFVWRIVRNSRTAGSKPAPANEINRPSTV
jgi:hypothetical protein